MRNAKFAFRISHFLIHPFGNSNIGSIILVPGTYERSTLCFALSVAQIKATS